MKRRTRGIFLIVLGLMLTFSATGIFAMYEYQADIAGDNAELLLDSLQTEMQMRREAAIYDPAERETPTEELPQLTLGDYDLVGILCVPSLGLELPILQDWSYDLLQISPCRYSGSVEEGNLILLGHNYKRHFTPLKQLEAGDRIEFCDVNGTVYTYEVTATEILQPTEVERLTATDCELTLFTCTNGGYSRFVVRCQLMKNENPSFTPGSTIQPI